MQHGVSMPTLAPSEQRPAPRRLRAPVVVVGYDGCEASKAALAYAARRVGARGRLIVVHACRPSPSWFGAPSRHAEVSEHEAQGRSLLDSIDEDLVAGIGYEMELAAGSPPDVLAQEAARHDADEIVVGTRGFFPIRGGLGSVSNSLLQIADRPVVVVPPASQPALEPS